VAAGFTLIEVLVATILLGVGIVGSLLAMRSVAKAQAAAQTADLLQRLAAEKLEDIKYLADPTQNGTSGDFSDRGYPEITWSLDDEASGVTNVDEDTVTVTSGKQSQSLETMIYLSQTATSTSNTTGSAAP
jgi:prepilin-type N-terminal cleavage/methylation domain-containing protein